MSSSEYLSAKNRLFEHLQQLDDTFYLPETSLNLQNNKIIRKKRRKRKKLRSIVQFLIREFRFLDTFLILQSFTYEPALLDVTQKVQNLFQEAALDFSQLLQGTVDFSGLKLEDFDFITCKVQNKIWSSKMDIKAKYSFPKISSVPFSASTDGFNLPVLIDIVVDNLDLVDDPETKILIEDVLEELKKLRNFIYCVSERLTVPLSQHHVMFLAHVFAVFGHSSMLSWLYLPNLVPEERNVWLSDFLCMRIKPIQPCIHKIYLDVLQGLKLTTQLGCYPNIQYEHSAKIAGIVNFIQNLVELHIVCNTGQRVALKDRLKIFQEIINFFRDEITFSIPIQDLESISGNIYTMVIEAGILVYSLCKNEEEKEELAPEEVDIAQVLDFFDSFNQHIDTLMYRAMRKAFQFDLPKFHGLGYVDFLLRSLKEFQSRFSDSLVSVNSQFQLIRKEFERVQPFLAAVAQARHNDLNKIQHCVAQLTGIAHEVEYILDSYIRKEARVWFLERWLLDIVEEIPLIINEVAEIQKNEMAGYALNTVSVSAHMSSNLTRLPRMNDEFVGFEDVITKLRDQLIKGTKELDVISICGMPGLGKTTLAYKLYYDSSVVSYFDIRAQCCVSQVYSRKDLLLALLRDATGENSQNRTKEVGELANELRQALFFKRYLILVDDIWDASAWDDLIDCFHKDKYGSRIILTTQHHEVAKYARYQSDPLQLRMFHDDESWDLLRKKVLGDESLFPPLTKIGKEIAKRCGRLPLSVSLVAGILAGIEKEKECWEQVADNLGSHIHTDSRAIIEHSYQNLPYHLRCCFLYFGAFFEDKMIHVSKLIQLWISEGFIKSCGDKSLEDIAEGYLENLLGRNLVMATKRSYGGKIEACHIHDLLHHFCKERAKEENFLLWIKRDHNANPSSSVYYYKPFAYRMFICRPFVSAIILYNGPAFNFSHKLQNFKFLKVLDLELTRISSFPSDLVYLRYFAAKTLASQIPSSLPYSNWNLETLILHSYPEKELPVTIFDMVNLRHLHIDNSHFNLENEEEFLESSESLYGLKSLSCPCFSSARHLELILRKTPNLGELKCLVGCADDSQSYVLNFPEPVETLEIFSPFRSFSSIPFCISAPNLKNLTLHHFLLNPQNLSEIDDLPNLQLLKLIDIKFYSPEWIVKSGEFSQLKVLELRQAEYFTDWNVHDDAFPNLELLVLHGCPDLKEIPSCFGGISTLMSIEVSWCSKLVNESATDICKLQVEVYQNTSFKVFINGRIPA